MKKSYLFFLLIFLFFAISAVNANENNLTWDDSVILTADNSVSSLELKSQVKIETDDLVKYYKNDSQFDFRVLDNGEPVNNATVHLKLNGIDYIRTTNNMGFGSLKINLLPGDYIIKTDYRSQSVTNNVKVISRFSAKDVTSTYGKQTKFSVTLFDKQGKPMKNKLMTFNVAGKKYSNYTNSKGLASIYLRLNAGTYTITYSADDISGNKSVKVKNHYKIKTYKWKTGADVTRNNLIKSNIPDSEAVRKIVKLAKSGTPVIKFKGGSGKVVFITAGVHGNEISSQVAAMRLIKYLENHPIRGTVFIMPFMHPKATSKNVRDYSVKLNSHADVKGTVSYNAVKLILKSKASAYCDFHCTMPGGKPGKNVAMGTYKPTAESAVLAKFISKKSKVSKLIYKKAGAEYPGALEDVVSLKGIPAVTCEVLTPHGSIASGSVEISLSMMKSLLRYRSLI